MSEHLPTLGTSPKRLPKARGPRGSQAGAASDQNRGRIDGTC
jgi:hypothetical protein